jgi:ubiquinone/menaquinone biosynthesis C-methylase UbiE
MATDFGLIIRNLLTFYDFSGKTVISVGAGGGQFAEFGRQARRVLAVDNDPTAIAALAGRLNTLGLADRFELVVGDFLSFDRTGDAVLFEFALHEIADPAAALARAKALAPDVVVMDHLPGSLWSFLCSEEDKVAAAWGAIQHFHLRRFAPVMAPHVFRDYDELLAKVRVQGETSIRRIEDFRGRRDFTITMPFGLSLL